MLVSRHRDADEQLLECLLLLLLTLSRALARGRLEAVCDSVDHRVLDADAILTVRVLELGVNLIARVRKLRRLLLMLRLA